MQASADAMDFEYEIKEDGTIEITKGPDMAEVAIPGTIGGIAVTSVGKGAFSEHSDIECVRIPDSVTYIGEGCFCKCRFLRTVGLGSGLKVIGDRAFADCGSLETIDLPRGLKVIGNGSFANCRNADLSVLPASLRDVGECAFASCDAVERFRIDGRSDYLEISDGAIIDRKSKALLCWPAGSKCVVARVPRGVRSVLDGAFDGCGVEAVDIPTSLKEVTGRAFCHARELVGIQCIGGGNFHSEDGVLYTGDCTRLVSCPPNYPKNYLCTEHDTKEIGPYAFSGCRHIFHLTIMNPIYSVGKGAFDRFESLTILEIHDEIFAAFPFRFYDAEGKQICRNTLPEGTYICERGKKTFRLTEDKECYEDDFFGSPFCERHDQFEPVDIKGASMDDIAGNTKLKQEIIRRVVLPARNPELFSRYGVERSSGILMYGPPGTGKTMMARAVAAELGLPFYSIKTSDILSKYVGEDEAKIRSLFESAREQKDGAVIFFDDFDVLGRARGSTEYCWMDSMVTELLVQMQGLEKHDGTLVVMAATNKPWMLDSALLRPGRFDCRIMVTLPDYEARLEILRRNMRDVPCRDIDFGHIAEVTEGYSGADMAEVCKRAKVARIEKQLDSGDEGVTMEDFVEVLESTSSTVSMKDIREIEEYSRTGKGPFAESAQDEIYVPRKKKEQIVGYN